ncbi:cap-specific mRNA (nucleoside-2'-O-)-methyltransferase 2 isoform X1 [Prorops nasuta]|uniref:cap-specific mRNA (nucleoside-2'-O-)-methyltransferase 2 isoform X1 n=1 Tax=Prorops nasuta TaxID=863751 RepID=UPI0034CF395F
MNMAISKNYDYQLEETLHKEADSLFHKRIDISSNDVYFLPRTEYLFVSRQWVIPELQKIKTKLNYTKSLLNNFELTNWQLHTAKRNKAGSVQWYVKKTISPEFVTQAWCKFHEIICTYPLISYEAITQQEFTSVHLCEAPGAFVTSLNHWLKTNRPEVSWNWIATTLNPYYEGNHLNGMIDDDRLIRHTLGNWCFGDDGTGNLLKLENMDSLINRAKKWNNVQLVTADGSINCSDSPAEQEDVVAHLHYCETIAALHMLSTGGSFLIKIFTTYEHKTVCLLYLLACCFDRVSITKPATSKEGNSETYVVCLGFKGQQFVSPYIALLRQYYENPSDLAMFYLEHIPAQFIEKIIESALMFKEYQCKVILCNKASFENQGEDGSQPLLPRVLRLKDIVAKKYVSYCNLRRLKSSAHRVVRKNINLFSNDSEFDRYKKKHHSHSFNERIARKQMLSSEPYNSLVDLCFEVRNVLMENFKYKINGIQLRDLPGKLWICCGKKFKMINSSKFCTDEILEIRKIFFIAMENLYLELELPSSENIEKAKMNIKDMPSFKCLVFKYTAIYPTSMVIQQFYEKLKVLEEGEGLFLIGYSLLTQVNVGLLHLIANSFHSVEFQATPELGYLIILRNFKRSYKVQRLFIQLVDASDLAESEDKTILTIYPICNLVDSPFYNHIVELNHWILKLMIEQALENINRNIPMI